VVEKKGRPGGAGGAEPPHAALGTKAKLAFSLFLVVFVFGSLEIVARALGAGDPEAFGGSRLLYQHIYPPLFVETPKGVWRPRDPRLVDRPIPRQAPPERVFVFGESAVAGLGMSENASFSRALERHLRKAGNATAVANVGIVALDSRQVHACVKDCCARQKPEWVVLHVGNNEFLEPHAMKFIEAEGKPFGLRLDEVFSHSRLFLALKNKAEMARTATLTSRTFSTDALRRSEHELIEKRGVSVSRAEIDAAVAKHLANLRRTVELAKASGARVILMTVATNLEWSGSKDPEGGWLKQAAPDGNLQAALSTLSKTIDGSSDDLDRWKARYERACVKRALGDMAGALEDFQKANDEDPHLRRCLSVMNENVRQLAKEEGCTLVDGAKVLALASKDGITGFDMLYDYVHFTPAGAERLGAAIARVLLGETRAADLDAWVAERDKKLAERAQDAFEVDEYLGWNADRSILSSRDLWKYEKARDALEVKAAQGTASPEELCWCANGHALCVGEEPRARELYAKARAAKPELGAVIEANLHWLDAR
jgi:lysophospholipase L1-like esterase